LFQKLSARKSFFTNGSVDLNSWFFSLECAVGAQVCQRRTSL
jgi:hypothetical protein